MAWNGHKMNYCYYSFRWIGLYVFCSFFIYCLSICLKVYFLIIWIIMLFFVDISILWRRVYLHKTQWNEIISEGAFYFETPTLFKRFLRSTQNLKSMRYLILCKCRGIIMMKSIHYKRRAFWIFVLHESNTFVEIIEKNMVRHGILNPQPAGQKSIVLTITPWKLHTKLGKFSMNRLKMYYFFEGQKFKMHVSYNK